MARFFFYGTLMDRDVLGRVIGRRLPRGALRPARLSGHRCLKVEGESFPVLIAAPGGLVQGRLVEGLTPTDVDRLIRYEGEHYRVVRRRIVRDGAPAVFASVFLGNGTLPLTDEPWSLPEWTRRDKKAFLRNMWRWLEGGP